MQYPVWNLGPGRRVAVWLQGCSLGCRGCISPDLRPARGGRSVDVRQLGDFLMALRGFDGVTISGGEPFEQYGALMALCAYLKARSTLGVFVFTGFALEELEVRHPDRAYAKFIDQLVDGRYVQARHEGGTWRGSTNQRLWRFAGGQPIEERMVPASRRVALSVPDGSRAYLSGVPRRGEREWVREELERAGLVGGGG